MEGNIEGIIADKRLTSEQRNTLARYERAAKIAGRKHLTRVAGLRSVIRFTPYLDGKRFEEVELENFERYMLAMQETNKTASTITTEYTKLHRFYTWLDTEAGEEGKYTRLMKKVRYRAPAGERHVIKAEQLPTQEEILRLIKFATSIRDKTLIAMLWDLGTRPHELLNLTVKDVHFDEYGAVITVGEHGKTGARTLRPIFSLPYIREWLDAHPWRDKKDAPLFPHLANNCYTKPGPLTVQSLTRSIDKAARFAGIEKRLYSYLFRHASITREASNGLGDQELKTFFGWTPDSGMLKVYSHLTSEDVNRKRLEQAGIIKPKEKKRELTVQICPRCAAENPVTHEYCNRCASPLNEARYRELMSREQEIEALKQRVDELQAAQGADVETLKAVLASPEVVELLARKIAAKKRAT